MLYRSLICGAAVAAMIAAQTVPAQAGRGTYSNDESEAIKCAAYFSYTSHVLSDHGLMTPRHREIATKTSYYILRQHVSGPFEKKLAAYEGILGGLPLTDFKMVEDSVRHLAWCEKKFLQ